MILLSLVLPISESECTLKNTPFSDREYLKKDIESPQMLIIL